MRKYISVVEKVDANPQKKNILILESYLKIASSTMRMKPIAKNIIIEYKRFLISL
jgi:hypothetical protein